MEKEWIISLQKSLNSISIPKLFLIYLVFLAIKTPNHFPIKEGISDTIRPITNTAGESLHYKKYLGLQIVQYLQVNEYKSTHNSKKRVPRVKFAWDEAVIYKDGSSL